MNDLVRRNKLTDASLDAAMLAVQANDKKSKA